MTSTEPRSLNYGTSREIVMDAWLHADYMRVSVTGINNGIMAGTFDLSAVSEDFIALLERAHDALTDLLASIAPES